jgi:hypothetical protein
MIIGGCNCGYGLLLFGILLLFFCGIGDGFVIHQNDLLSLLPPCTITAQLMNVAPATTRQHKPCSTRCNSNLLRQRHIPYPSWIVSNQIKKSAVAVKLQTNESSKDDSDATAKGIVSIVTDIRNSTFDLWSSLFQRKNVSVTNEYPISSNADVSKSKGSTMIRLPDLQPPSSSLELLQRIRDDYTERNYLWTGDLDVTTNFIPSCRFKDPTLSFIGTDQYTKNIQNVRMVLNLVTNVDVDCQSILLDIQSYEKYIETRWNMVGTLSKLPWKPRIDVIGKTKFWYNNNNNNNSDMFDSSSSYRIYFYDEIWEIPANQALLQLITPEGTIPNTYM